MKRWVPRSSSSSRLASSRTRMTTARTRWSSVMMTSRATRKRPPLPSAPAPDEKEQKAIKKEGGKKGSEIAGAADMGGMSFMNCSLDSMDLGGKTIGEVERMVFALSEMNRPVEEGAEETKGGSGHVAKALFSYGDEKCGVLCYVPEEH